MSDRWTTPERQALRELARDLVAKEIAPHMAEWEREGLLPRSLHKTFADAGLLGISFAEEVGGAGGDAAAPDRVTGSAHDFCLLVTQRRHRADTQLTADGPLADEWLSIAQCFAGPPGGGREPR